MLGCFSRLRRLSSNTPPPPKPSAAVFKSFNSLYEPTSDTASSFQTLTLTMTVTSSSASSDDLDDGSGSGDPDQISSAMASPGRSDSIVDSAAGVAVEKYSPDPYRDFRRSMEEMVASLGLGVGRAGAQLDLAVLRELLLRYLALNCKDTHNYIVSAFADVLLSLSMDAASAADEKGSGDD